MRFNVICTNKKLYFKAKNCLFQSQVALYAMFNKIFSRNFLFISFKSVTCYIHYILIVNNFANIILKTYHRSFYDSPQYSMQPTV